MFKKAVEVKGSQRLSGADRKKLRRNVREKFANAAEADIDLLLPPKVFCPYPFRPN
jgi:translation initiation factor 2D